MRDAAPAELLAPCLQAAFREWRKAARLPWRMRPWRRVCQWFGRDPYSYIDAGLKRCGL